MSYQIEFPDYPVAYMPTIPAAFEDTSWRNDCCPCFTSETLKLILWVEYPGIREREFEGGTRYLLCSTDTPEGQSAEIIATDDWQAVLDAIAAR